MCIISPNLLRLIRSPSPIAGDLTSLGPSSFLTREASGRESSLSARKEKVVITCVGMLYSPIIMQSVEGEACPDATHFLMAGTQVGRCLTSLPNHKISDEFLGRDKTSFVTLAMFHKIFTRTVTLLLLQNREAFILDGTDVKTTTTTTTTTTKITDKQTNKNKKIPREMHHLYFDLLLRIVLFVLNAQSFENVQNA